MSVCLCVVHMYACAHVGLKIGIFSQRLFNKYLLHSHSKQAMRSFLGI